jgi:CRISPR-associated protein Csb1
MTRFDRDEIRRQNLERLPDILESNPLTLRYEVNSGDGRLQSHMAFSGETVRIRDGAVKPGGITMEYALHTWTLSLTQLRRLRFPVKGSADKAQDRNAAARTVLAALALYALALQNDRGYWLRSRCELIPEGRPMLELLGGTVEECDLPAAAVVREKLLDPAITEAETVGLRWEKKVVCLTPAEELKKLVLLSDARVPAEEDAEEATADVGAQG